MAIKTTKKQVAQYLAYLEELKLHPVGWNFWTKQDTLDPYTFDMFCKWLMDNIGYDDLDDRERYFKV